MTEIDQLVQQLCSALQTATQLQNFVRNEQPEKARERAAALRPALQEVTKTLASVRWMLARAPR